MIRRLNNWLEDGFTTEQFTYRQLRSMFVTLLLDSFFILFIGMLSTAMVSSTGETAMAAVNMVGALNSLVWLIFSALATGGAIVVARSIGSGDLGGVRSAIGASISLCGLVGLVMAVLLYVFAEAIITALYPVAEPLLLEYSIRYLRLLCISFFPYSVFNAIFSAFRSVGDAKSGLFLTIVVNTLHLVCSFVFINIMKMGMDGAGLSYIVARVAGMVVGLIWILKVHNEYHLQVRHMFHFPKDITTEMVKLGIPIASESALFQGGMLLVQVYLAYLTTMELAAHGVANSVLNLYMCAGNALTTLTTTVCGKCYGAKQYDLARRYCKKIVAAGRGITLVSTAVFFALTPLLLKLYSPSEAAMPIIYTCLTIGAVGLPLIWADGYIIPMALRAAGDAVYTSVISVVGLAVGRIVVGYILTIVLGLGVPGVWIGLMLEWLLRAVCMRVRLNGDKWLHIKKAAEKLA